MATKSNKILPMKTAGTQHLIDRTYREGGRYQWVREVTQNALEAGARRITFSVEWQAVERQGVYRRTIADDGAGMTAEQLLAFFATFGGGGKKIGGVHENFGVGAKTSLLPWNPAGVVVVSWVGGKAAMVWIERDAKTGEYGLRLFPAKDPVSGDETLEAVVTPFDDTKRSGTDWRKVRPAWLQEHGTVLVLLGADLKADTVRGDPTRSEDDLKGIGAYLNRRYWEIPAGIEIVVEELRSSDKKTWPTLEAQAHAGTPNTVAWGGVDRRVNRRLVMGARHYTEYTEPSFKKGRLAHSGVMTLKDETKLAWYLWEGERPNVQSYAAYQGFVAAIYHNELYDVTNHLATYRAFGVGAAEVRQRLWLVAEPPPLDPAGTHGVYPRTDRNALLIHGGGGGGEPLPWSDWAAEFADNMPEPIREALREARKQDEGVVDESWRERLLERLGTRWKIEKLRVTDEKGEEKIEPTQPANLPAPAIDRHPAEEREPTERESRGAGGVSGGLTLGEGAGAQPASRARVAAGIPTYRLVPASELEPGMLAAWVAHDPEHHEGVVLINEEHPVIRQQVKYWVAQYPAHLAEEVERDVLHVYGQIAVAKVAHSERLRGMIPSPIVDQAMRSDAAMTMALIGILAEEAVIAPRLGAKYGRKRLPVEAPAISAPAASVRAAN